MCQIASWRRQLHETRHALLPLLFVVLSLQLQRDGVQGQQQQQVRRQQQVVEEAQEEGRPTEQVAKRQVREQEESLSPTEQDMSRLLERVVLQGQTQILEEEEKRRLRQGQEQEAPLLVRQVEGKEIEGEHWRRHREKDPLDAAADAVLQQQEQLLQQEQEQNQQEQQQLLQQRQQHPPPAPNGDEATGRSQKQKQQKDEQVPKEAKYIRQLESDHLQPLPRPPLSPINGTKISPGAKVGGPLSFVTPPPPPSLVSKHPPLMSDFPSQDRSIIDPVDISLARWLCHALYVLLLFMFVACTDQLLLKFRTHQSAQELILRREAEKINRRIVLNGEDVLKSLKVSKIAAKHETIFLLTIRYPV